MSKLAVMLVVLGGLSLGACTSPGDPVDGAELRPAIPERTYRPEQQRPARQSTDSIRVADGQDGAGR